MLEEIVNKTGLMLSDLGHRKFDSSSVNPFAGSQDKSSNQSTGTSRRLDISSGFFAAEDTWNEAGLGWESFRSPSRPPMASPNVMEGTRLGTEDPEKYLNDLLAENLLDFDGMQEWGEVV